MYYDKVYRLPMPKNQLIVWPGIPRRGEAWDALGRREKSDLIRPKDIKGLLRRCHNKLHGRGIDGDEEDLTMDMVRLILAKAIDEEKEAPLPEFYCTPEEYLSLDGQKTVAKRIQTLFEEVVPAIRQFFLLRKKLLLVPARFAMLLLSCRATACSAIFMIPMIGISWGTLMNSTLQPTSNVNKDSFSLTV